MDFCLTNCYELLPLLIGTIYAYPSAVFIASGLLLSTHPVSVRATQQLRTSLK